MYAGRSAPRLALGMSDMVLGLVPVSAVSHGGELGFNEEGDEGRLCGGMKAAVERGQLGRVARHKGRQHFWNRGNGSSRSRSKLVIMRELRRGGQVRE